MLLGRTRRTTRPWTHSSASTRASFVTIGAFIPGTSSGDSSGGMARCPRWTRRALRHNLEANLKTTSAMITAKSVSRGSASGPVE